MAELKLNEQRRPEISKSRRTSLPWLFAGGDIVRGIDAYLQAASRCKALRAKR